MTRITVYARCITVVVGIMVLCAFSGPNERARVVIDHNAATDEIEEVYNESGSDIYVAVKATNVTDLAGFCITVAYDTTQVRFKSATLTREGGKEPSFLESQGGKKGPVMVIPKDGTVEVVAGIKTTDTHEAPDGDGTLAYLKFVRLINNDIKLTIKKVELSNSDLIIDNLSVEE